METGRFPKFRSGVTCPEDGECLRHPLTNRIDENTDLVSECVHKNKRFSICEIADMSGTLSELLQSTLKHNLNVYQIATKYTSHACSVSVCT
jgi:hypothetical protein